MLAANKSFLHDYWRIRPRLFSDALTPTELAYFPKRSFLNWCSKTKRSVRLFHASDEYGPGQAKSSILRNQADAGPLFQSLRDQRESATLHMNGVELLDERVFNLRQAIGVPYWWRTDDVIATLSSKGSGIGFHAGHEDGFIVQLRGVRRWRVWNPNLTPLLYRCSLLDSAQGTDPKMLRATTEQPVLDCTLSPGDALYIPPFFPHEGITIRESLSISIAWKGLAPASFLPDSMIDLSFKEGSSEHLRALCRLFPDSSTPKTAIRDWRECTVTAVPRQLQTDETSRSISHAIRNHFIAMAANYSVL